MNEPVLWKPTAGTHALALVGAGAQVLDRVTFTVRGAIAPVTAK